MLTLEKFERASELVKEVTSPTKLVYSEYLSEQTGGRVYLKPENMQHTGAYKRKGSGSRFRRQPCPGRCFCGAEIRLQSHHRNADSYSADQSEPHQELWRGSGPSRRRLR